jgi:hypothetical protein
MSNGEASYSFNAFRGTVQGTLLYLSVYGSFLTFQSFSKFYLAHQKRREMKDKKLSFRKVKYYNSDDTVRRTLARLQSDIAFTPNDVYCRFFLVTFFIPSACFDWRSCRRKFHGICRYVLAVILDARRIR